MNEYPKKSVGRKILSGVYIASAADMGFDAWKSLMGGIFLLILGIVLFIIIKNFAALILSAFGLLLLFLAWVSWRAAKRAWEISQNV